jgi:hypothetical protein
MPESRRKDKIELDPDLVAKLYKDCDGWVQRIHEILAEEKGIEIGYSTLTSKIRELGLGTSKNQKGNRDWLFHVNFENTRTWPWNIKKSA